MDGGTRQRELKFFGHQPIHDLEQEQTVQKAPDSLVSCLLSSFPTVQSKDEQ